VCLNTSPLLPHLLTRRVKAVPGQFAEIAFKSDDALNFGVILGTFSERLFFAVLLFALNAL